MRPVLLVALATLLAPSPSAQRLVFDESFSEDGSVLASSGSTKSLVLDDKDRALVAARANVFNPTYLRRINPDGEPDETFGDEGSIALPAPGNTGGYGGVIATRGGDIYASGHARVPGPSNTTQPYILRFQEDGTPHPTSPRSDGPIQVRYQGFTESPTHLFAGVYPGDATCGTVRLLDTGAVDSTFATDGVASLPHAGSCRIEALGSDAEGRIVVGTTQSEAVGGETLSRFVVMRFLSDGTPDAAFGEGGRADVRFEDAEADLRSLDVSADGTVTAVGTTVKAGVRGALVVRWQPSGERDASFGFEGLVYQTVADNTENASFETVRAVLVSAGGAVTVFGSARARPDAEPGLISTFVALRLGADGALDTGFGEDGYARFVQRTQSSEPIYRRLGDVRLDSEGRFVYAYTSGPSFQYVTVVARMIETTAVAGDAAPSGRLALRAFPNPTPGRATVAVTLDAPAALTVAVHDALGRLVARLADGPAPAGRLALDLDASRLAPGVYVVRVVADGEVQTARLSVVR